MVARDEDGARLVRLNEGLALRTPDGFRYLCPALWGEDAVAPAHAMPDGPAVIGAGSGLLLVTAEGAVEPHPDPAAAGRVLALAASAGGLFALRQTGDLYQVLRVLEDRVQVLFGGTLPWDDLAASDQGLQLLRLQAGAVHERRLSFAGEVTAEDSAVAPEATAAVVARLAGDVGYAIALTSALSAELGRIEQGSWRSLQTGRLLLAGPVETPSGERFVAVDGELARFDEELAMPVGDAPGVTCLRRHFELAYACSERGLRALAADGLGASLFALEELAPPDLDEVPSERREDCMLQWQRYEVDLRAIGIVPRTLDGPDAGAQDAGSPRDAAPQPRSDAGERPMRRDGGGCSCRSAQGDGGGAASVLGVAALALAIAARRRSKDPWLRRLRTGQRRPSRRRRTS